MQLWGAHWAPGGVQSCLPALAEGHHRGGVHAAEKRFTLPAAQIEDAISRTLKSPSLPAKVFSPTLPSIALSSRFEGGWILERSVLWHGPRSENIRGTPLTKHCRSYNLQHLCPISPSLLSWQVARSRLCNDKEAEKAGHLQTRQYQKRRGALSVLFQPNPSESSCINLLITTLNWRFIQKMYNGGLRRAHFRWLSCQSNTG